VSRGREVGIDLEHLRSGVDIEHIAARFFAPGEAATLRTLPTTMRNEAFFRCWTRKEAYIKARGEGLSLSLDQFAVTLTPGQPAALLQAPGDLQEVSRWSLQDLTPAPGYVAALAVEGGGWQLACWRYPDSPPPSKQ
jgi:4'-phosphopantetheinyl transferase